MDLITIPDRLAHDPEWHLRWLLTGYQGDTGASCSSSSPKTSNCAQVGIGTVLIHMLEWTKADVFGHPIRIDVFRALVDGERYGSDKGNASEGGGDT